MRVSGSFADQGIVGVVCWLFGRLKMRIGESPFTPHLWRMRCGACVIGGGIQAVRSEGIPVQVRLPAPAADVLVAAVDLAAVVGECGSIVERWEDVWSSA